MKVKALKYITLILLFNLPIWLFSQSFELPPDSLIKKYRVKSISSYFNSASVKHELSWVWKFNTDGQLISRELFDNEDTTLCVRLFFYKEGLLVEDWNIGVWRRYDTIKTSYHYDVNNKLINELSIGKYNHFNIKGKGLRNEIFYSYPNDSVMTKKYKGNSLTYRGSGTDSVIYNPDGTIKLLLNKKIDLKTIYKYNENKQLISETNASISNPNLIFWQHIYFYKKGELTKEIARHSVTGEKERISDGEYFYINNDKGLLIKIQRPFTFETYVYEYF